jgi:hypothetical protein
MQIQGQLTRSSVRGDPVRIVQLFLVVLALAGVAAMVVLAPGAAGSTHQSTHRLADPGVASQSLAPDSMVWDVVTS